MDRLYGLVDLSIGVLCVSTLSIASLSWCNSRLRRTAVEVLEDFAPEVRVVGSAIGASMACGFISACSWLVSSWLGGSVIATRCCFRCRSWRGGGGVRRLGGAAVDVDRRSFDRFVGSLGGRDEA